MLLELSVQSYHRLSPKQEAVKRFDSTGGTLGRSPDADWSLPDPERVVSSIHASIEFVGNSYKITDKSTNGLFVNRSVDALGEGNSHNLCDGDVLCLGDYEIKVALIAPNNTLLNKSSEIMSVKASPVHAPDGFAVSDLLAPQLGRTAPQLVKTVSKSAQVIPDLVLDDHFLPPQSLIPDDWNNNWQEQSQGVNAPVREAAQASLSSSTVKDGNLPDNACLQAFLKGVGVTEVNESFLGSVNWWEQLGQAFGQSLAGVLAVMRERSQVKRRFRVNQTTFEQKENNPLKFSASVDDAFYNLFNRQGASFMPARQAIAEAFSDISQHEAAIIAGAHGAMVGMLHNLSPEKLEVQERTVGFVDKLNPAKQQARCWSRYKQAHQDAINEIQRQQKSGLNDDFIAAYEAYLRQR